MNERFLSPRDRRRIAKRTGQGSSPASSLRYFRPPPVMTRPNAEQRTGRDIHSPAAYDGRLFLYLEKPSFADAWLNGGPIPLFPARKYLGARTGVMTPDEVRQHRIPDGWSRQKLSDSRFIPASSSADIIFENCAIDGVTINGSLVDLAEDSQILCLSTMHSQAIQDRLGKAVCLEVTDIDKLRESFDMQLGRKSVAGAVNYTSGEQRGHFLKSVEDEWQKEYRVAWIGAYSSQVDVIVPDGVASVCAPM